MPQACRSWGLEPRGPEALIGFPSLGTPSGIAPNGKEKILMRMPFYRQIATSVWKPDGERPGYLKLVRTKTIGEVYDELRAVLGEYPDGGEEYFVVAMRLALHFERGREAKWPDGRIACFSVNGSSEGDYTHVEVHPSGGQERIPIFLGKTFMGRDASWAFARRLADLLEWQ